MKTFEIKNQFVLSKLNCIESRILNINYDDIKIWQNEYLDEKNCALSEKNLKKIMSLNTIHEGLPNRHPRYCNSKKDSHIIDDEINKHNCDLTEYMFSRTVCLDVLYPPKSYCEWHNNADASGYGIMFTWSETGEGDFRYWDNNKKEVVSIPDKKGWNFKHFYFGNYDDPKEKLVYHASSNDCLRYSMAFHFVDEKEVWEDTIQMLMNHE